MSVLQKKRLAYSPVIPDLCRELDKVCFRALETPKLKLDSALLKLFPKTIHAKAHILDKGTPHQISPLKVGVIFSGGPASGGHNVIAALFHALKLIHPQSQLFGFLNGPSGMIDNKQKELEAQEIGAYLNQGGFDLIGSGRTKIETEEQLERSFKTCQALGLNGLVIIGGDDSNTNAAVLAEYFQKNGSLISVIGAPKTIDGDLQSADIEISFGFDTACKTYSELIGNIAKDALSTKKYYHFIKLMGRSASHIALECALATQPNLALIGEEKRLLSEIVGNIADLIVQRAKIGKEYGVILIPEGLIEFIPELQSLIRSLRQMQTPDPKKLEGEAKATFANLPEKIQRQMLFTDQHGNLLVSQIDTQMLLIDLVKKELSKRDFSGAFSAQEHFLGYEGRSCFPSNFDANYCYTLGILAALCIRDRLTGMICSVQHLAKPPRFWTMKAIPITSLMHLEMRKAQEKPVIAKALVDLKGKPFSRFANSRKSWELQDHYQYPGPIQFFGDPELTDGCPLILQ